MKRMNKRGQFYLLAAILIITAIVSYAAISNYSKTKNPTRINDLGKELGIEGGKVLEYGVIRGGMDAIRQSFAGNFTKYSEEDGKEIYYIFGDKDGKICVITESILSMGNQIIGGSKFPQNEKMLTTHCTENLCSVPNENKIKCTILGTPYEFKLNPGENFYFVISQKIGEEEYVVSG